MDKVMNENIIIITKPGSFDLLKRLSRSLTNCLFCGWLRDQLTKSSSNHGCLEKSFKSHCGTRQPPSKNFQTPSTQKSLLLKVICFPCGNNPN